jgi:hypothetical protein
VSRVANYSSSVPGITKTVIKTAAKSCPKGVALKNRIKDVAYMGTSNAMILQFTFEV